MLELSTKNNENNTQLLEHEEVIFIFSLTQRKIRKGERKGKGGGTGREMGKRRGRSRGRKKRKRKR